MTGVAKHAVYGTQTAAFVLVYNATNGYYEGSFQMNSSAVGGDFTVDLTAKDGVNNEAKKSGSFSYQPSASLSLAYLPAGACEGTWLTYSGTALYNDGTPIADRNISFSGKSSGKAKPIANGSYTAILIGQDSGNVTACVDDTTICVKVSVVMSACTAGGSSGGSSGGSGGSSGFSATPKPTASATGGEQPTVTPVPDASTPTPAPTQVTASGVSAQDAQSALDAAMALFQKATGLGLDASSCESLLNQASTAFAEGNYAKALELANQAEAKCSDLVSAFAPPAPDASPTAAAAGLTGLFTASNAPGFGLFVFLLLAAWATRKKWLGAMKR